MTVTTSTTSGWAVNELAKHRCKSNSESDPSHRQIPGWNHRSTHLLRYKIIWWTWNVQSCRVRHGLWRATSLCQNVFVHVASQLSCSLKQRTQRIQMSKNHCQTANLNMKLSIIQLWATGPPITEKKTHESRLSQRTLLYDTTWIFHFFDNC